LSVSSPNSVPSLVSARDAVVLATLTTRGAADARGRARMTVTTPNMLTSNVWRIASAVALSAG